MPAAGLLIQKAVLALPQAVELLILMREKALVNGPESPIRHEGASPVLGGGLLALLQNNVIVGYAMKGEYGESGRSPWA